MTIEQAVNQQYDTDQSMQPGAGNLGLTRRSYERLYYNARNILGSVDYLVNRMVPWTVERVEDGGAHRRIVGRILMTDAQLSDALRRSDVLQKNIEAVVPVGEYRGKPISMVMWGINRSTEQPLDDLRHIARETEYASIASSTPSHRVNMLRHQGFEFTEVLDAVKTADILSLWGPIFEWPEQDIDNLRIRLRQQKILSPEQRSVWFTAITRESEVVALAMAERLNLPLGNGESVPVVESTEWCVQKEWQNLGLAIGAITHVHAQVIQDLRRAPRPPVIVAETNFTSRADRIGHGAGMTIGSRFVDGLFVPQVLRQNVAIGDGLRPDRLRDFTMMYIPAENIQNYYSQAACNVILGREI